MCTSLSQDGFWQQGFWEIGHLLPPFGPSWILLVSLPVAASSSLLGPPVLRQLKKAVIIVTLTLATECILVNSSLAALLLPITKQRQWPFNTPSRPCAIYLQDTVPAFLSPPLHSYRHKDLCSVTQTQEGLSWRFFPGTLFLWLLAWQLPLILGSQFKWSNPSWGPSPLFSLIPLHCKGM